MGTLTNPESTEKPKTCFQKEQVENAGLVKPCTEPSIAQNNDYIRIMRKT